MSQNITYKHDGLNHIEGSKRLILFVERSKPIGLTLTDTVNRACFSLRFKKKMISFSFLLRRKCESFIDLEGKHRD